MTHILGRATFLVSEMLSILSGYNAMFASCWRNIWILLLVTVRLSLLMNRGRRNESLIDLYGETKWIRVVAVASSKSMMRFNLQ